MPFGSIPLNDGRSIPAIAFGTGSVWKGHDTSKYVTQALESGFSHIDTAAAYQNEDSVGQAIRESALARDEFYITTKYPWSGRRPAQVEIEQSLNNLGIKSVDLYLIHSPNVSLSIWNDVVKIREQGLAKSIGVSNFLVEHLQTLTKINPAVPAVNQINLHPYNYAEMKPVLDYCATHKIVIEAYGSLAPLTKFPGGPVDAPVAAAALLRGASPAQILQLWIKSKGAVIVTTSSKREHLEEYLAVADLAPLTDQEISAIEEAGAKGPPSPFKLYMLKVLRTSGFTKLLVLLGALSFMIFYCHM